VTKPQQPELARSGHSAATEDSAKSAPKTRPKSSGRAGKVPPSNRPGHHPDHEQDKPDGPPPRPRARTPKQTPKRPPIPQRPPMPVAAVAPVASVAEAIALAPDAPALTLPRTGRRFAFAFDGPVGTAASLMGVRGSRAVVEAGPDDLVVRFGRWAVRTPLSNVAGAIVTGPYSWPRVVGPPRLSLVDRGLTFATNAHRGVRIHFHAPVRALLPWGPLRHPSITVTVDDPDALADYLTR